MITVKEAVKAAYDFFKEMYPSEDRKFIEVKLEEVEKSDDGKYWLITIGYSKKATIEGLLPVSGFIREYKLIKVRSSDGEVQSMKILKI